MARSALLAMLYGFTDIKGSSVLCFIVASVAASTLSSRTNSLSDCAVSSALLWLYCVIFGGKGQAEDRKHSTKILWRAGGLLGFAQLCSRVSGDVSGWSQVLIPWIIWCSDDSSAAAGEYANRSVSAFANARIQVLHLVLANVYPLYVFGINRSIPTDIALGICKALISGIAISLISCAFEKEKRPELGAKKLTLLGPHGEYLAQSKPPSAHQVCECTKDLALALAITSGLMALLFEESWVIGDIFVTGNQWRIAVYLSGSARLLYGTRLLSDHGALNSSVWNLGAAALSFLICHPTWTASLCALVSLLNALCVSKELQIPTATKQKSGKWHWLFMIATLAVVAVHTTTSLMGTGDGLAKRCWPGLPVLHSIGGTRQATSSIHPIKQLVSFAEHSFEALQVRQSRSLAQAVVEYKRRYGIPPPPLFDEWYKFARKNDIVVLDDYDTIHGAMQPFWAFKPSIIRARAQEALGNQENALIVLLIRNGRISQLSGGLPWQREAIAGMITSYVSMLPDLDVAFNAHDEPRVVLPHDELSRMISIATTGPMTDALLNDSISNHYSRRPLDMSDGMDLVEYKTSRFNEYAHQSTWAPSRLSCPPDSPARALNEDGTDDTRAFALGSLNFVSNQTASTDICNVPSLQKQHAFFDRPNAFSVAHELIPIFSESKISSFQDIPYPSLWHWYGAMFVNSTQDMHLHNTPMYESEYDPPWSEKQNTLYWRGSTTGGFSRNGGWRRHHRQRLVQLLNAHDQATILVGSDNASTKTWQPTTTPRAKHSHLFDVAFSGVGQCDKQDCHAQEEFFPIATHAPLNATWQHRHVLDIDGNAFSARFYALLRSRSLVYKAAIFREWHDEWLTPWLHYIPLSISGDEALEALRFFADGDGAAVAEKLADASRQWAGKVLRRVDMEAWMFRCLLEYARVVDDNRSGIGYFG